ncbi:MAG: hypothetical protein IPN13_11825 [Bacteroidetes bacterium]|nr:hypothetical protein [Bacteroidota bacterium]
MVIPAVHNNQANAPVFFFDGGPGVAATKNATFFSDSVNLYRLEHDIVLIDVRGTGESIHCTADNYNLRRPSQQLVES